MEKWETCYEKHKKKPLWRCVEKAIKGLERNQDLKITTHPDYVVGYLVETIAKDFRITRK